MQHVAHRHSDEVHQLNLEIERLQADLARTRQDRDTRASECAELAADLRRVMAENERLRATLKPFAEVGDKFQAAWKKSGAFPAGASARFMKLEPLTAQQFLDASNALRQQAGNETHSHP